ncbi:extracellular solute-binding protein [uncultured Metabacillus sp.]|uniref:extracellular solute-binding protein n=1 Tax=uncultured Metabacillus sp. TaxID=2860135 RepID=UPI002613134F|nr:extracellular solute-binding protein [uncultured Metabacillus sp.]
MKILFCLIHLTIFLLLAGCNDSVLEGSISKKEKITLEFFSHKTETERIFEELIQEFEKLNPGIDVNQVIIPEGMTVLKTRIARGDTPDIFITYPIEQDYIIRAEKGYLLELTNEPFLKNIQPIIQNRYLVNGKMYGVALTQNAVGVLYNKDHFQELGLPIPETWDTFVRTLEELRSKGKTAILMPNKEANRSSIFNLNFVANEFNSSYWEKDEFSISNDKKWREVSEKIVTVLSYVQPDSFRDDYYTVTLSAVDRNLLAAVYEVDSFSDYVISSSEIQSYLSTNVIVKNLTQIIDWQGLDCEIIGTAHNGQEALEMMEIHQVDLLLTDISMPGITGIELLKKINSMHHKPIVILISGYNDFEYAIQGLKHNAWDYILKPID